MLALLASMVLCVVALWLLLGAAQALLYRWLQPTMRAIDPAQASVLLVGWLALAPVVALLTAYLLYSPDIAGWLVAGHCHSGQCVSHGPRSGLAVAPAAVLALWALCGVARCLWQQWLPVRRLYDQLTRIGDDRGDYVALSSALPTAFTLGWLRPRIFISEGMRAACTGEDIDCILRHENAHRRRRDNLRLLAGRILTAPLPQRLAHATLDDLKLCCEKACDLSAAAALSREAVAAALLRVARLQQGQVVGLAFAGNQTQRRVLALLEESPSPLAGGVLFTVASATLLFVLALVNPLHRAIELLP